MVDVNIFIQLTMSKMLIQYLSHLYTHSHKKHNNIYTTNIIDIVTITASWLIGM